MWKNRKKDCNLIYVVTNKNNIGPKLESVFPGDSDGCPILYFQIDRKGIHLIIPKGPVTIYSPLLKEPINDENIFDAFNRLDKEIDLKISYNKNKIEFEYNLILDTIHPSLNKKPILNFITDRGVIQIEIPNGEVTIWHTDLPTNPIKRNDIFVAFKRLNKWIGYKRKNNNKKA